MKVVEEMTMEDVNEYILQADLCAQKIGFKNADDLGNYKVEASAGMINYGGSFTSYLGHALAHADCVNTCKLVHAFKPMCDEFRKLFLEFREKLTMTK